MCFITNSIGSKDVGEAHMDGVLAPAFLLFLHIQDFLRKRWKKRVTGAATKIEE